MAKAKRPPTPADPHAQREAERYSDPIASRELILETLAEAGRPLAQEGLAAALALQGPGPLEALRRRLRAMCRDGQLMMDRRGRYVVAEKLSLVRGKIAAHRDGFAWLLPQDGSADVYLHDRALGSAMDGDEVLVRITGARRDGKPEGAVAEILARAHETLVGQYFDGGGVGVVQPAHPKLHGEFLVRLEGALKVAPGSWVRLRLTTYPENRRPGWGEVDAVLAPPGDLDYEGQLAVVLGAHGLEEGWPAAVEKQVARLPKRVPRAALAGRVDLRDTPLVTIDGEDAKDFDDAVFAEARGRGGWRLLVAIADVSHYVTPHTDLDEEAQKRGTSVYFPGRVIPMLPEALSNGLCSLMPKVDRLAMVCEMTISPRGRVTAYRFFEAVIQSAARLTYTEVGAFFDAEDRGEAPARNLRALAPQLRALRSLYKVLWQDREMRGALDFSGTEARIVLDEHGRVAEVAPVQRNDAHRLIEACMITANSCAARLLSKAKVPTLYRNHAPPSPGGMESLAAYLGNLGIAFEVPDPLTAKAVQALLARLAAKPETQPLETMVLRALSQANYGPERIGHFGLALTHYAHFTSPIRRYPDLLVHRGLRALLQSDRDFPELYRSPEAPAAKAFEDAYPYDVPAMLTLGASLSLRERGADAAAFDFEAWLKCEYAKDHLDQLFEGTVTAVTHFGLFVTLDSLRLAGLLHVTQLPDDYYHFDEVDRRLSGEQGAGDFALGDRLRVRLSKVDTEARQIDLAFEAQLSRGPRPARRGRSGRRSGSEPHRGGRASQGKKRSGGGKGRRPR